MRKFSLVLFTVVLCTCVRAQTPEIIRKERLQEIFSPDSGIWVINAWASWCKPCLMEMPHFREADSLFGDRVNFVFVSYDFAEDSARVAAAINRHSIPGKHFLINETDMNELINSLDSAWSGTLPATWFLSPIYRKPVYYAFGQFDDIKKEIEMLIAASYE